METPEARGPLTLRVVHPAAGAAVQARDAAYLIGSVGNGAATLSVDGRLVAVHRNGSFLAYLPLPEGDAPAYRLVAVLRGDTVRQLLPVRLPARSVPFVHGGLAVDTASMEPRELLRLRAEERVPVRLRAPADAEVWIALAGGARHPLVAGVRLPPGEGGGGGRDPELWGTELPAARLAGGAALVVARAGDTVRLPLPPVTVAGGAPARWVRLHAAPGEGAEREIVGRPTPGGEYRWFLLPGTALEATGARGARLRVRLDAGTEAWVDGANASPLEASPPPPQGPAGHARLRSAPEWVDLVVPLGAPPPYRVEQGEHALSLIVHGVEPRPGAAPAETGDVYVRGVAVAGEARDRVRYTLRLAGAPYGYRVFWSDGALVLRVRRPPAVRPRRPLRGLTIAVDAGHPPHGAVGPTGLHEAEVTLQVALRLRRLLQARGARVVLTRENDAPVALEARTAVARRSGAHALVSLHADALADGEDPSRVNGTATFFFHPQSAPLAAAVQRGMLTRMGRMDRGVRPANLAVARATWMPSVLSEGAMIVHPEEEAALRTPAFQQAYARGVADGLEAYFRALGRGP